MTDYHIRLIYQVHLSCFFFTGKEDKIMIKKMIICSMRKAKACILALRGFQVCTCKPSRCRWWLETLHRHAPLFTAILLLSLIVLPSDEELGLVGRPLTGSLEEAALCGPLHKEVETEVGLQGTADLSVVRILGIPKHKRTKEL